MTARRHASNKNTGISCVTLHSHTVTQNCATGKRRRRVNRQHRNFLRFRAQVTYQRRSQSALARTWRTGDANHITFANFWIDQPPDTSRVVTAALDQRKQSCEGCAITGASILK
jgi:hypothetical protein